MNKNQKLKSYLETRFNSLKKEYRFNESNGWNQVKGLGEEVNRAYGEFEAVITALEFLK